jgi:hypothetical protein
MTVQRYWLSVGDGVSYGPYTVEELRTFMIDGRVTASSQLCLETEETGAHDWFPAGKLLPELAAPPRSRTAVPPIAVGAGGSVRQISLAWSIVATVLSLLLCCLPIGVVPLIIATNANARYAAGDFAAGEASERNYRTWMIVTWVLLGIGLLGLVLQIVLGVSWLMSAM